MILTSAIVAQFVTASAPYRHAAKSRRLLLLGATSVVQIQQLTQQDLQMAFDEQCLSVIRC